jgi:hypothetical protein
MPYAPDRPPEAPGKAMTQPLTREEFVEHLSALERRLLERLDLLERLISLGFDDASDQLRLRLGDGTTNAVLSNDRN